MKIKLAMPISFNEMGSRANQEDSLFPELGQATEQQNVFLVCDGMGGHSNGEVASQAVAQTIGQYMSELDATTSMETMQKAFKQALEKAYAKLDELDQTMPDEKKMGTTLTFLGICSDGCLVAHIGDSRVYQLRPEKGIQFQTVDHSLVNSLIQIGEITPEEAKNSPIKNTITRAIMPHQEHPAKADFQQITDVKPGDCFFLCSDGVNEQVEDDEIAALLVHSNQPYDNRVENLKKLCAERATRDNHTCYFIPIAEVKGIAVQKPKSIWKRIFGI